MDPPPTNEGDYAAFSMLLVYFPLRAALLSLARWWYAFCPAAMFSVFPAQALSADSCRARPYENESCQGRPLNWFIAFRCAVASAIL